MLRVQGKASQGAGATVASVARSAGIPCAALASDFLQLYAIHIVISDGFRTCASPEQGRKLLGVLLKRLGLQAAAVGLSAALLATCLSAGASEVLRYFR